MPIGVNERPNLGEPKHEGLFLIPISVPALLEHLLEQCTGPRYLKKCFRTSFDNRLGFASQTTTSTRIGERRSRPHCIDSLRLRHKEIDIPTTVDFHLRLSAPVWEKEKHHAFFTSASKKNLDGYDVQINLALAGCNWCARICLLPIWRMELAQAALPVGVVPTVLCAWESLDNIAIVVSNSSKSHNLHCVHVQEHGIMSGITWVLHQCYNATKQFWSLGKKIQYHLHTHIIHLKYSHTKLSFLWHQIWSFSKNCSVPWVQTAVEKTCSKICCKCSLRNAVGSSLPAQFFLTSCAFDLRVQKCHFWRKINSPWAQIWTLGTGRSLWVQIQLTLGANSVHFGRKKKN